MPSVLIPKFGTTNLNMSTLMNFIAMIDELQLSQERVFSFHDRHERDPQFLLRGLFLLALQ